MQQTDVVRKHFTLMDRHADWDSSVEKGACCKEQRELEAAIDSTAHCCDHMGMAACSAARPPSLAVTHCRQRAQPKRGSAHKTGVGRTTSTHDSRATIRPKGFLHHTKHVL